MMNEDLYDKIVEETASFEDFEDFMNRFYTRSVDKEKLLEFYRQQRKERKEEGVV